MDPSVGMRQPDGTIVSFSRKGMPSWLPHNLTNRPDLVLQDGTTPRTEFSLTHPQETSSAV
ncbi:MAG: hypothetical protein BJ554DRAFT_3482 [Olpidium bornovanus]|uniref:Uncharacterized protein n=1 Tax=Olpidium bornovanus TaxID=278681 RepID=A0A8H8DFS8_9FUNG|nr:MAG: hypothetical protein BJ554DRAFT_3482 [Olpidium bornovanus]